MSEADPYIPNNLGQKRKLYNECVRYWIESDTPIISEYIQGEDVEKLMNIDIACAKQDLDFVLNTLTDEDMLYVSRTLKQSTWIITDNKYANIVNPDYLHTHLIPKMTSQAVSKFMKHIRLHLKDESRVETFYSYEKNIKNALKWLPNCSVTFVEQEIIKHAKEIDIHLFKRLSEKSTSIWKILISHKDIKHRKKSFESTLFILYKDTHLFMDKIEESKTDDIPDLGVKGTKIIMKNNSQRVIDKLQIYLKIVHKPTFAQCLKPEEVRHILYKIVGVCTRSDSNNKILSIKYHYNVYDIFDFDTMKHFVQQIPIDQRYPFVKQVFIDKIHDSKSIKTHEDTSAEEINKMANLFFLCKQFIEHDFVWYKFAPFEEALAYIKKKIKLETRQYERNLMLKTLMDFAGSNIIYRKKVLQYFYTKHLNDKVIRKEDFVCDYLSSKTPIQKYDERTWNILDEVFRSMDVFKESVYVSDKIIEAVIVYNIVNNKKVPDVIESKFKFDTLKQYGVQMDELERDKIFNYLYNFALAKYDNCTWEDEQKFKDKVHLMHNVLTTLKDWKKNLVDFPNVLDKIKECIQIKRTNNWENDLSQLYNIKKSWKKLMFEESMFLNPSEEVCLNVLKHDAGLLKQNESEIITFSYNNKVSLSRLLSKLRIFWSKTLAKDWADEYIKRIKQNDASKEIVRGLCAILPHHQILNIIEQYAPETSEINWENIDPCIIEVQRNIAKYMHTARPQPPPDVILRYAKGDYLQYALPSVLAIFHNLSHLKILEYIPSVFNAPVSLQKHGLRLAVEKIPQQDIIDIFNNTWKKFKNATIRAVIFKLTFSIMSKEKDIGKLKELWEFLSTAIDSLSFEEDREVYELLGSVEKVPLPVRALYIEKAYSFMAKMFPTTTSCYDKVDQQEIIKNILREANTIMYQMCPKYVTKLLLEFIEELNDKPVENISHSSEIIKLLASFLLASKTEEIQNERFNSVCLPFIKCFQKPSQETIILRLHVLLRMNLVKAIQDGMVLPENLFLQLHQESSMVLPLPDSYVLLTELQLFADLFKIIKNVEKGDLKDMLISAASEFGKACVTYLQKDIANHFPLIYSLFSQAIINVYMSFKSVEDPEKSIRNSFCRSLLYNKDFTPAYLTALKVYFSSVTPTNRKVHQKKENKSIIDDIFKNNSVEIRLHYYSNVEILNG